MATLRQPPRKTTVAKSSQRQGGNGGHERGRGSPVRHDMTKTESAKAESGKAESGKAVRPGSAGLKPEDGGSGNAVPLLVATFGAVTVACIVALPTVPIVLLGMIPTAVAMVVDRTPGKTAAICVAGLNFAGIAPFVATLWKGTNTLTHSLAILTDVYSWLAMYGAAALGWLLAMALPPMVGSFLRLRAAQRVAALRDVQAGLRAEWGVGPAQP